MSRMLASHRGPNQPKAPTSPDARRSPSEVVGRATAPPIVHEVLRTPGEPLDVPTRAFMESRFGHDFRSIRVDRDPRPQAKLTVNPPGDEGEQQAARVAESVTRDDGGPAGAGHDFSRVRIHADARAAESADSARARAYTFGQHIVFGPGEYAPGTESGRRLLAHELTHTIQHGRAGSGPGVGPLAGIARQAKPGDAGINPTDDEVLTPPVDNWKGTPVSEVIISLARGRVGFRTPQGVLFGTVDTDLPAGSYKLTADSAKQNWTIDGPGVKEGLRFTVDLSESLANPWTLAYPASLPLTVAAGSTEEPKTFADMRDDQGKLKDPLWLYEGGGEAKKPAPVTGPDDYDSIETVRGTPPKYRVKYRDNTERLSVYGDLTPKMKGDLRAFFRKEDEDFLMFTLETFPLWWNVVSITPMVPMPSAGARPFQPGRVPLAPEGPPSTPPIEENPLFPKIPLQRPAAGQPPETVPPAPAQEEPPATVVVVAPPEEITIPVLQPKAGGPGVNYGQEAAARLATQGKRGGAILTPLVAELNGQPTMTPGDKAIAVQAACNAQGSTFGAGPIAKMPGGNLVVLPRAANPSAPVIVVTPEGLVAKGNASVKLVNENTSYHVTNVTLRQ